MEYYPVLITTLNRYQHFKNCVESLSRCTYADKTELMIGLDYPPSEKYVDGWKQIKNFIHQIKGFKEVTVFERSENYGSSKNAFELQKYAYSKYDAIITTEDDNVFSPCFLDYMNQCLEKYRDDPNVVGVSGYMFPVKWSKQYSSTVAHLYCFDAWGIGRWKEKQERINKEFPVPCVEWLCSKRKFLRILRKYPTEFSYIILGVRWNPRLDRRCDITYTCFNIIKGYYLIAPFQSLVQNHGNDGSGQHNPNLENMDIYRSQIIDSNSSFKLIDILNSEEEKEILQEWKQFSDKNMKLPQNKYVNIAYWCYFLFGYSLGRFILKILDKIYSIMKQFKNILKIRK